MSRTDWIIFGIVALIGLVAFYGYAQTDRKCTEAGGILVQAPVYRWVCLDAPAKENWK